MSFGGRLDAYDIESEPFGTGGYAYVFEAVHRTTGRRVALKRLQRAPDTDARSRMRREIRGLRAFSDERHVMPILDWSEDEGWYAMPLAGGDLVKLRSSLDERGVVAVIQQAGNGLAVAHKAGWVHRDVKPQNILRLGDEGQSWVVADWGLVRGPRGMTSNPLTRTRQALGTEGFMAPEVLDGAHHVTEAADVFGLARVLAWMVTDRWPLAGDLEPPPGVFRRVIRDATAHNPADRLALKDFVQRVGTVPLGPLPAPLDSPEDLLDRSRAGDERAVEDLLLLADDRRDDADLHLDLIVRIPADRLPTVAMREPRVLLRVATAVHHHLHESFGRRDFDYLNTILGWLLNVAMAAEATDQMGLLEDVCDLLFEADPQWDRWLNRQRVQKWLNTLRHEAAQTVARSLDLAPKAVEFYGATGWQPQTAADTSIRRVFAAQPSREAPTR